MKRLLSVLLCICMVMTLIPAMAMATGTGYADLPDTVNENGPAKIEICSFELTDGEYLASNDATEVSENYTNGTPYVAVYKNGILYLNGLNVTNDVSGKHALCWGYSNDGKHNLIVELIEGTSNVLVSHYGSAIEGHVGLPSGGPSLTIQGHGTLDVTGATYGFWVWDTVTVQGGATVNATGNTGGICNNTSGGGIVIKSGTEVTVSGGEYGAVTDHERFGTFSVEGGTFTATGNISAVKDINSDFGELTVYVSENVSGEGATEWDGTTALTSYKYISTEAPAVLADMTYAYAYDCQRSPAYPGYYGDEVELWQFTYPCKNSGDRYEASEGIWALTEVGTYGEKSGFDPQPGEAVDRIVGDVASNYQLGDEEKNALVIHKLNDEDGVLVGYGVVIGVDETNGYALFIGDALAGGAGYLLSKTEITDDSITFVTEEIVHSSYSVSLSPEEVSFDDAEEGYSVPDAETITVTNTGDDNTGALTVTLSGDSDAFTLSKAAITDIAVGENDTFTVVPVEDLSAGTYEATITVSGEKLMPVTANVSFTVTEAGEGGGDDEEEQPTGKKHYGGLQAGGDMSTTGKDKLGSEYEKEDEPEAETKPVVKPDDGVCDGTSADRCPAVKFSDLNTSAWYHADVDYAIAKGLFNGTSNTAFSPNGKLTRAMLVAVLYRAEGSPATNKSIPFADVDMSAYYANAVIWAQQNRIVTGVSETKFAPDENITREQIATILFRYASYKGRNVDVNDEALSFADAASVSDYALAAMTWNIENGFVQGRSGNMLAPREFATRAEAAALLHRFLEAK